MEILEQIGSYAGLAAVVGLAVLSILYFSQARDVKRLREWAGRAPERTGVSSPSVVVKRATPVRPGAPAGPATGVHQPPATPSSAAPVPAGAAAAPAPAGAMSAPAAIVGAAPAATQAPPSPAGPRPSTPGARPPGSPVRPAPAPARPAPAVRRPASAPMRSSTAILTPPTRGPWYRRVGWPAPRYLALIVGGILIVGGGVAYGVVELLEENPPRIAPVEPGDGSGLAEEEEPSRRPRPVDPSKVTVAVLNGTTFSGLAKTVADQVERQGFRKGEVTNATDQARAESVVKFATGAREEARAVAKRLRINQTEPIDEADQALAGDATVVVIVGADRIE